jgi:hypothetical protein
MAVSYAELLVAAVREHLFGHLFHMSDESHLDSIEEHGLLSAFARHSSGIVSPLAGGNGLTQSLDADRGLSDMVFLSFFNMGVMPSHGHARRRRQVLLKIDPSVLLLDGVKVALGRANRRNTRIYSATKVGPEMDWDAILGYVDDNDLTERWRIFKARDYEVLVPTKVPAEYIVGFA